jgi:hypothetical protein
VSDLRISELPPLLPADAEPTDDLAVADYSASQTAKLSLAGAVAAGLRALPNGAISGAKLIPESVTGTEIASGSITSTELATDAVVTISVADQAITNAKLAAGIDGAKLVAGSVGAAQLSANAITAAGLADGAVDTAAVLDGAITNAKLAAGIDGAKLSDGTITNAKLAGGIPGSKLVAGSISTRELAAGIVTATELADNAVDTAAVQDAAITNAKLAAGIDGAKLTADSVSAAKIPQASLDRGIDKTSGAIGHTNAVTAGSRNGITFDAYGHVTGTAALVPSDLPAATATAIGGVSVPTGSGLAVSGVGALAHSNTVAAGRRNGITYDAHGHITGAAALVAADLPTATSATAGAASFPGPDVVVSGTGSVTHAASGVAAGVYAKVTVSASGHVTAGASLTPSDIPSLDASKITGGVLDPGRIKDGSITRQMLADYSITYIQEGNPPASGNHAGTLWLQESTGQLRMWNSNSWFPIGFGRLSAENLRYCGTFNAATGAISGVTPFGVTEGFKLGDQVPAASDKLAGVYLVVATPGNGTAATAGVAYDAGDWILCNGVTAGWTRIDTLSGGGGGGGATHLNDLLDVTISTGAVAGDLLQLAASGQWLNVSELDCGGY